MSNIMQMAMNLISRNPNIANNPQAQNLIQVIQNGNAEEGQKIAQNLCQTYGVSPEDAIKQAKHFFNIPQ